MNNDVSSPRPAANVRQSRSAFILSRVDEGSKNTLLTYGHANKEHNFQALRVRQHNPWNLIRRYIGINCRGGLFDDGGRRIRGILLKAQTQKQAQLRQGPLSLRKTLECKCIGLVEIYDNGARRLTWPNEAMLVAWLIKPGWSRNSTLESTTRQAVREVQLD